MHWKLWGRAHPWYL